MYDRPKHKMGYKDAVRIASKVDLYELNLTAKLDFLQKLLFTVTNILENLFYVEIVDNALLDQVLPAAAEVIGRIVQLAWRVGKAGLYALLSFIGVQMPSEEDIKWAP